MHANPVRDKLRAGGTPMGVMAFDFFTPGPRADAGAQAGAEFVLLDMEHSGVGIDTIKTQMRAGARRRHRADGARAGVPASPDRAGARRRRDGHHGAAGGDARAGGDAGQRVPLSAAGTPRPGFGMAHDGYSGGAARAKMDAANDAIITIALIESARGIENAERSSQRRGSTLPGSVTTTCPTASSCVEAFDDPRYVAAEQRLLAASNAAGIPVGLARRHRRSRPRALSRAGFAASASATS